MTPNPSPNPNPNPNPNPHPNPDRDLLFQTAELTWQAYNGYGGYTTYGSFDYPREHAPARRLLNLSEPGHQQRRAYKRSLNTPLITRDYRACNMPLHAG